MVAQYQQFAEWLRTPLGQALLEAEKKGLKSFWEYLRGKDLYMLGTGAQMMLTDDNKNQKNIFIAPGRPIIGKHDIPDETGDSLSIFPESIDNIFLPHTLEFTDDPYQALREVDLALCLDGHVIIIGFNPWSNWGLRHLFSFRKKMPWKGVFRSASQIKDWLRLLNFEILQCQHLLYRPPFANKKIFSGLKFLETLGKYLLPMLGGVYILIARKKTFGVTPIKEQWKEVSKAMSKGMIEPAARIVPHEQNQSS
jgi:hypothetical protein